MKEFNKGWGAGLYLQIPLGFQKSRSEKFLSVAKEMGLSAQKEAYQNTFRAPHVAILKGLKLLSEGLKTQEQNSKNLTTNYNEVRLKFNQGRIPLAMVISEQDLLFQSRLQEINIKKMIAHTLLDYFGVFTEHPCSWNKK
jgi:outer membrane protein TolC